MKNLTLDQHVDREQNRERKSLLRQEVARAERIAGRSFGKVEIRSVQEMGEAAGTCEMCTGNIKLREDMVNTTSGIREHLANTLVHEGEHADGNPNEGITELLTCLRTGASPVPAYAQKVEHARHLMNIIGKKDMEELATEKNPEIGLLVAYIRNNVAANTDVEIKNIAQEGARHIKLAA